MLNVAFPTLTPRNTMDPVWWAYAVDGRNRVIIVRCETRQGAVEEKDRMKSSGDAQRVGFTTKKISELDFWRACRERGWKLVLSR